MNLILNFHQNSSLDVAYFLRIKKEAFTFYANTLFRILSNNSLPSWLFNSPSAALSG